MPVVCNMWRIGEEGYQIRMKEEMPANVRVYAICMSGVDKVKKGK